MFYKGEIPFVRLLIPLIGGILIGMNWPGSTFPFSLFILCGLITSILLLLVAFYARLNLYKINWLLGIMAQFAVLCAGALAALQAAKKYNADYFANSPSQALVITVTNEPIVSGKILRFEADVDQSITSSDNMPVSGKLLVSMRNPIQLVPDIKYGARLIIPADYREVEPPYNPGEFDYKNYLAGRQIYHQIFIDSNSLKLLSQGNKSTIVAFALSIRRRLVEKFYQYLDNKDAAALASTLILGYRASLNKDIISAYSTTGTLHVLSVSGMHVGIVFIVLTFILSPLRRISGLKYPIVFTIISAIWSYALITGFSPSVCRAAAMLSIVLLGKALNRDLNSYNLLAISAFVLLIYNPYYLVDVGFQLSYLAVFGLIYLQPKIYQAIFFKNRLLDYIWQYTALSLAAQLATFPISLYYFHQFPVYFLLSNLIVVLPVALIMYIGILFLFIPWPPLLTLVAGLLSKLIVLTNKSLFIITELPLSTIGGVWINAAEYLMIYIVIGSIIMATLTKRKLAIYLGLGALILFSASISIKKFKLFRRNELIFYSLRRDAAVAYIAKGRAYLISKLPDSASASLFSIKPGLESRGVTAVISVNPDSSFTDRKQKITMTTHVLQFEHYRVLRWNSEMNGLEFSGKLTADAVLLNGNPKVTVGQLKKYVHFPVLLIDASNTPFRITKWQTEAKALNIPVHILKGSPAYIVRN